LLVVDETSPETCKEALILRGIPLVKIQSDDASEKGIADELDGLVVGRTERHTSRRAFRDDERLRRVLQKRRTLGAVHVGRVDARLTEEVPVSRRIRDAELTQNTKNLVIRYQTVGEIPRVVDLGFLGGSVLHSTTL
jgi:hypothetical protein